MNIFNKVATMTFLILSLILCGLSVAGMDADDAPATVTIDTLGELYEAVVFDHEMHSDGYECISCHHQTTGTGIQEKGCVRCHANSEVSENLSCSECHKVNKISPSPAGENMDYSLHHIDIPGLKGALHLQCLGCHRIEGGPVGCQACHGFTEAGRKRFAVKSGS